MEDDITNDGYQFDDDTSSEAEAPATDSATTDDGAAPATDSATTDDASAPAADSSGSAGGTTGGGKYAQELMSKTIQAKFRTFYIDLKESSNGKFVKISEKSHGRKSTIMMDGEDVAPMIEALQEISKEL